eukprot:1818039-Rhodomonas_salina.2
MTTDIINLPVLSGQWQQHESEAYSGRPVAFLVCAAASAAVASLDLVGESSGSFGRVTRAEQCRAATERRPNLCGRVITLAAGSAPYEQGSEAHSLPNTHQHVTGSARDRYSSPRRSPPNPGPRGRWRRGLCGSWRLCGSCGQGGPEERDRKRHKFAVEMREQQASVERLELENQQMEQENQRMEQENGLALLENCTQVIQFRNALSERPDMSSTDMQLLTTLCNHELSAMAKVGNPDGVEMTTVTKEALSYGFPLDPDTLKAVDRLAADTYEQQHGHRPRQADGC